MDIWITIGTSAAIAGVVCAFFAALYARNAWLKPVANLLLKGTAICAEKESGGYDNKISVQITNTGAVAAPLKLITVNGTKRDFTVPSSSLPLSRNIIAPGIFSTINIRFVTDKKHHRFKIAIHVPNRKFEHTIKEVKKVPDINTS